MEVLGTVLGFSVRLMEVLGTVLGFSVRLRQFVGGVLIDLAFRMPELITWPAFQ